MNELYETLRQQSPKQRYGTSTSPLLLDFFNTTSQPQSIWKSFIACLNKFCDSRSVSSQTYMRDAPEHESTELVKETFRVFITHNLLYGSFIDPRLLAYALSSVSMLSFMQQCPTAQPTQHLPFVDESALPLYSIIIYCILAITFQSAHQSLPNMNENFTNSLYRYSHAFYREAHKRFIATCFPSIPADPTVKPSKKQKRKHAMILAQAAVLLTHFQCTAICEEQAFMTIKIGLDLVQQCSLTSIDSGSRSGEDDDDDDDDDGGGGEKESLFALLKSLDAWYVWLAFYLQKPYSVHQLDMTHIASETLTQFKHDDVMFPNKNKEQKWALHITDAYTCFLKSLLQMKKENQCIPMDSIKVCL